MEFTMKTTTTIQAISELWNSIPQEWGMCGTVEVIYSPDTVARFRETEDGFHLDVLYPNMQWEATGVVVTAEDIEGL
jgi:hypothetical protein